MVLKESFVSSILTIFLSAPKPLKIEHLQHLQYVFERLKKAGLTLKPRKCCFLRKEVIYLDHVISGKGIAPDPAKTQKVHNYPVPTDLTKLRQFIGLASYYRRFIPGFSQVADPLYKLMNKGAVFEWIAACQMAFNRLKQLLTTAPILSYPQFGPDAQFILETDASLFGLGAVLAQKKEDGHVYPVAFASRTLNPQEKNYGITEMETLAVV